MTDRIELPVPSPWNGYSPDLSGKRTEETSPYPALEAFFKANGAKTRIENGILLVEPAEENDQV